MHPAALVPGAGKDLVERLPEAERAIADGNIGRDLQATPLHVDQQLPPALCVLANACLETDQFLPAFGRGADQDQHAFGLVFRPRLEIDPVRPHIDIAPRRKIALLPTLVIGVPLRRQPRDRRG